MTKTKSIIYCGLFTALIAVGAFIKIPIPVVPFTLQYLFTMLAGLLLGSRRGSLSVIAYIILGLAGLLVVYACGMIYYYVICNYVINTPIGVWYWNCKAGTKIIYRKRFITKETNIYECTDFGPGDHRRKKTDPRG